MQLFLGSLTVLCVFLVGGHARPERLTRRNDLMIIGGDETTIEKFPYQVALEYLSSFRCGGSILNENFILTAAHCLYGTWRLFKLTGRAGSSLRHKGGQTFYNTATYYHPKFSPNKLHHDVGLLRLAKPLTLSETVQPVPLVRVGASPSVGDTITLSGWGVTKKGDDAAPTVLRTTQVAVTRHWQCRLAYLLITKVSDNQFCAGAWGKDSCQGDSGGPAVNAAGEQVGIVSFGLGCAMWPFPGVYTDLSNAEVREYIDQVLSGKAQHQ